MWFRPWSSQGLRLPATRHSWTNLCLFFSHFNLSSLIHSWKRKRVHPPNSISLSDFIFPFLSLSIVSFLLLFRSLTKWIYYISERPKVVFPLCGDSCVFPGRWDLLSTNYRNLLKKSCLICAILFSTAVKHAWVQRKWCLPCENNISPCLRQTRTRAHPPASRAVFFFFLIVLSP